MDDDTLQQARVSLMIPDARRRIARLADYPTEHHRCVIDGRERHYVACRGVEIAVDPNSRSSMEILKQWTTAFEDAAHI